MSLTRSVLNCETGESELVELTPEEEAEFLAGAAPHDLTPPVSERDQRVLDMVAEKRATIEASNAPAATKALLGDVLDGLAAAITGGAP